jgi:hypothetical protein
MEIIAKYSCAKCRIDKREIKLPARENEPVIDWMDKIAVIIGADHTRMSPRCPATHITELMIPTAGTDRIGGPTVN